jgi:dCMP deaminase
MNKGEIMEFSRPSWDEYFVSISLLTKSRSNCIKRKVGCLVVKDNRILSLGYNGTPINTKNCYEGGCKRCMDQFNNKENKNGNSSGKALDLCMCLHAEENALLFVNKTDLKDSTMYVTLIPCISCVKKILQCKIKRVVYIEDYSPEIDSLSKNILKENNVILLKWENV